MKPSKTAKTKSKQDCAQCQGTGMAFKKMTREELYAPIPKACEVCDGHGRYTVH